MATPRAKREILPIVALFTLGSLGPFLAKRVHAHSVRDTAAVTSAPDLLGESRVENRRIYCKYIDGSEQGQHWPRFYIPFNLPRR